MSLKDTLVAEVERLKAVHEKNRLAYREAKAKADEAARAYQELSNTAYVSANELAAAERALRELQKDPAATPKREITGQGGVGTTGEQS